MTRRRRNSQAPGGPPGDHDGILDVLANLVGVLTLVGALSAVVAANAAIQIKTPMSRSTNKSFLLVVAGKEGVWNLQPAKDALFDAQQSRIRNMRGCLSYGLFAMSACFYRESERHYTDKVGAARYRLDDVEVSLQRSGEPDLAIDNEGIEQKFYNMLSEAKKSKKAIFVLLEKEGFLSYRALRQAATQVDVELGWEPWETNERVYFGSSGRSMNVQ